MRFSVVCLLLGSILVRAEEPANDRFRPILIPVIAREELVAVRLDRQVYSRCANTFADLRVRDSEGARISHTVRPLTITHQVVSETAWTPRLTQIKPLPDGSLQIDIDLEKEDTAPSGLRIVTPMMDFSNRVRVIGLKNGEPAGNLSGDTAIWDYSSLINSRNDRVPMAAGTFRSFRIVVDKTTEELESQLMELTRGMQGKTQGKVIVQRRPFRIDRVDFYTLKSKTVSGDPVLENHDTPPITINFDSVSQSTRVTLESSLEPVTRISLGVDGGNFNRQVTVEGSDRPESGSWRTLGTGTIRRLSFQGIVEEFMTLTIPETRLRVYRLAIADGDSPPVPIKYVTLSGPVREVIFVARPGIDYQLEYGDAKATAPRLDAAAIDSLAARGFLPVVGTLGEETTVQAGIHPHLWKDYLPWIIGTIITFLGVLLALGLYNAARKVKDFPDTL